MACENKMKSVKVVAELPNLKAVPSNYSVDHHHNSSPAIDSIDDSLPVVDFSLLSSEDPHQHSKAIQDLGRACEHWGFFMVVNHGIAESLMKELIGVANEFFLMPEEDKWRYKGQQVFDPIKYGTSFNYTSKETTFYWRDYLKLSVHPAFHSPHQPKNFRELVWEYCEKCRKVTKMLLSGISESLGLEEELMRKSLDLDSGFEIFTNGKYKSVLHRAVVKKVPRISIGIANCPAMNATVRPAASPLIQNERLPPLYLPMKFSEYVEMQQTKPLDGKSSLDEIKIKLKQT
ncbi:2-oxoglutarate-dependent dioxygenase 19-like isoform X2 [Lycium ferocissimum]|uniref:2-oxoglutarate-dependent dioxygenase 19-like isoform X2 n=1 Tax=Lycium ferocissimum TaxID=112874 RepID=UPI0028164D22|nr:2-oxoglutarate-dependent dioxygenase 19-like isoform X2 [Lycium ferocissimum]